METLPLTPSLGWVKDAQNHLSKSDLMVFADQPELTRYFGSVLMQYLTYHGNTEASPLYGKYINNLEDFLHQIGYAIPNQNASLETLEDARELLSQNFTQPQNRFLIWFDADYLLKVNEKLFKDIALMMNEISVNNTEGGILQRNALIMANGNLNAVTSAYQLNDIGSLPLKTQLLNLKAEN
ncbi:MAG: hypothetical protein BRD49_04970 [Bacteroidetes bacterium SW_10_40_5]|nr:MAG: hypothetical protein BRD49_04970 [Bacteroidetes bacterium SW_10_40_5]